MVMLLLVGTVALPSGSKDETIDARIKSVQNGLALRLRRERQHSRVRTQQDDAYCSWENFGFTMCADTPLNVTTTDAVECENLCTADPACHYVTVDITGADSYCRLTATCDNETHEDEYFWNSC